MGIVGTTATGGALNAGGTNTIGGTEPTGGTAAAAGGSQGTGGNIGTGGTPTELTATLSNNFAPALRPRPRILRLAAVSLASGLLAATFWLISRESPHEVTATVSSQSPPHVVQLGSPAATGTLNRLPGEQPVTAANAPPAPSHRTNTGAAPSASAAASASSAGKHQRLAGTPQRKPGAQPAAAKTVDPKSMRR